MAKSKILIVEDERITAENIQVNLNNLGYAVTSIASSGKEAVKKAKEDNPDLVLMDIKLNGKMEGIKAAEQIRSEFNIPVVYLTAYADKETLKRARITEPFGYIIKPFGKRELHSTIEMALYKHRMDKKLRETQEWLSTTLKSIGDAVIATDRKCSVTFMNFVAEDLTGWKYKDAAGIDLKEVFKVKSGDTGRKIQNPVKKVIKKGVVTRLTNHLLLITKDRKEIPIDASSAPIRDDKGNITEVVVAFRDISEHKCMEEALKKSRASFRNLEKKHRHQIQTRDQFLSHVSHELRTPLSVIHQFVTVLLDGLDGDITGMQREDLEIILRNTNQLSTMIRDLLDVTRIITGKLSIDPQPISVADVTAKTIDAFQMRAAKKGVLLISEVPNDLPFVFADPVRIGQILSNLIDNAVKFTPENEMIAIRGSVFNKDPDFLCIEVADTGCGMDPKEKKKIFDYLYQANGSPESSRKGLGLGLYICKEIVYRHGGRIWVESQPGEGSTFFFTLPVFSFARLLAPILTHDNLKKDSLAVVTVGVFPPDRSLLPRIWENAVHVVREVLKSCLFPDSEVLLPRADSPKSGEIFYLVACAREEETEGIVERIKRELALCEILQDNGIVPSVSYAMIDISKSRRGKQLDQIVKKIARKLEKLVKGGIQYEEGIKGGLR